MTSEKDIGAFFWSPDGSTLLYLHSDEALKACDFVNKKTWFGLPSFVSGVRAVSLRDILRSVLPPSTGWKDDARIEWPKWVDGKRFIVELGGSSGGTDSSANGALVLVQMNDGKALSASQLNPKHYSTPVRLTVSQISSSSSIDLLTEVGCDVFVAANAEGNLSCAERGDEIVERRVDLGLEGYCADLTRGDAGAFCATRQKSPSWNRIERRGANILVRRHNVVGPPPAYKVRTETELYMMGNDYLVWEEQQKKLQDEHKRRAKEVLEVQQQNFEQELQRKAEEIRAKLGNQPPAR